jgi:uncharacterized Zn-binding protein involved in type VI secretion
MSQPAARMGDFHACPMVTPGTPPIPHVGGPIIMGAPTVLTCMMPQARIGDQCVCVGPPDVIAKGSPTVLVCSMPAARMGDNTAHGGVIAVGAPTVLIGMSGSGGGGGGGGGGAGMGQSAGGGSASGSAEATENTGESGDALKDRSTGASTGEGMPAPNQQAQTLQNASDNGTPVCEACQRAAEENAKKAETQQSQVDDAFGSDFGDVQPHTGPSASNNADSMGAEAYSSGSDVHFGGGDKPSTAPVAHEAAHIVQQDTGMPKPPEPDTEPSASQSGKLSPKK